MVLAALCVQHFYIDFATWITSHLHTSPTDSVACGYIMLFFCLEALFELLLNLINRQGREKPPVTIDQVGGALYGLLKASIIVILPIMALSVEIKIPSPPKDQKGLVLPFEDGTKQSFLIPLYGNVAHALIPIIGNYVVSYEPPSFKPDFTTIKIKSGED